MSTMFKAILVALLTLSSVSGAFAQAYLGNTTKQVNLREGPGTDYAVLRSLVGGTQLFIVSTETVDGFYEVIDIRTNTEGYVHSSFVRLGERVELNEEGVFTPAGRSATQNPELQIYNNTRLALTLKMNEVTYQFQPQERRTLTVSSGSYSYRASAPGVIPDIGLEFLDSRTIYTWEFYIITQH
jgi:uncharacterized protein YgiM (DUF1202 family)